MNISMLETNSIRYDNEQVPSVCIYVDYYMFGKQVEYLGYHIFRNGKLLS